MHALFFRRLVTFTSPYMFLFVFVIRFMSILLAFNLTVNKNYGCLKLNCSTFHVCIGNTVHCGMTCSGIWQ